MRDDDTSQSPAGRGRAWPVFRTKAELKAALKRDFDSDKPLPSPDLRPVVHPPLTPDLSLRPAGGLWRQRLRQALARGVTVVSMLFMIQGALLSAFSWLDDGSDDPVPTCADLGTEREAALSEAERLALRRRCTPEKLTEVETLLAPAEKLPEEGVLVDQPDDVAEVAVPAEAAEDTQHYGRVTTRTDREQVKARSGSKAVGASHLPVTPRGEKEAEAAPVAEEAVEKPQPSELPEEAEQPVEAGDAADTRQAVGEGAGDAGGGAPSLVTPTESGGAGGRTVMDRRPASRGGGGRILSPTGGGGVMDNYRSLQGEGGGRYAKELPEGDETILNANSYRYAGFFQLVKKGVQAHWDPREIYRAQDPTGARFGDKDRYTVLTVTLGKGGEIQRLRVSRPSGLAFMDEEAVRAFRAAAPFLNPPVGLFDEAGEIRFEFGFYFEIVGGGKRTNWRRL